MQITPLPPPLVPSTVHTSQTVTQALPQVQALAATPIVANAVAPPPKSEKSQRTRDQKEERDSERKEEGEPEGEAEKRGGNVNLSV